MSDHGNSGFRVKNLRDTSSCTHMPRHLRASNADTRQCASHQCTKPAIRACHVILANQNVLTGKRYIVYLCDGCNKNYRGAFNIRANAECHELIYCDCGSI